MPRLVLLSMQRSGTNWFMDLVNRLPQCLAIREAFNARGVFGIDKRNGVVRRALARRLGVGDLHERTPEAIAWVRDNPEAFVDLAAEAAAAEGFPWFGLSVFNGHLAPESLRAILRGAETRPVILLRQQLPRYVSLVKAQDLGVWKGADTTVYRPAIDVAAFAAEAAEARRWFGWLRGVVPGDTPVLTYEEHVRGGPDACLLALTRAYREFDLPPGLVPPEPSTVRQDRAEDVFAKVSAGDDLRRALADRGLMAEAFAHPL